MSLVEKSRVQKSFNHHVVKVFVVLINKKVCHIGLRKNTIGYTFCEPIVYIIYCIQVQYYRLAH